VNQTVNTRNTKVFNHSFNGQGFLPILQTQAFTMGEVSPSMDRTKHYLITSSCNPHTSMHLHHILTVSLVMG